LTGECQQKCITRQSIKTKYIVNGHNEANVLECANSAVCSEKQVYQLLDKLILMVPFQETWLFVLQIRKLPTSTVCYYFKFKPSDGTFEYYARFSTEVKEIIECDYNSTATNKSICKLVKKINYSNNNFWTVIQSLTIERQRFY